ncbi:MAG: glycosyltransferase family 4 protein [Solirubrobacteraceae bacterium]|nr:glycosyltransferase family 4 protein [Solirubrobacteraceae bacterium]
MTATALPPIAYVVGDYPAPSHAFVQREILGLRARGADVHTFSIRRADATSLLTDVDRDEDARTEALRPIRPRAVAHAFGRALRARPGRLLAALRLSQRQVRGGPRARLWGLFYLAEALLVWERCTEAGVRHLHAHHLAHSADIAMLAAALGSDRADPWTWSFTMHGPDEFSDVPRLRLDVKVADAAAVMCISHFCRSQIMGHVPAADWDKLHLVRCGVDSARFAPADAQSPAGSLRVLCVGRLVAVKGQALLIEATATLRARGVDVVTTLVGRGPERERLEALAAELGATEHVRFTGALGQDDILTQYHAADAFCLPSFAEGVPVVLMEAMSCELPVVTTRIMGIPELVQDEAGGLLVAPGQVETLADALERLAADPELRARLGRGGRARVQEEFEIADCVEQLVRALASATSDAVVNV